MQPFVGMTVQYYPRVEDEGAKQAGVPLAAIVAAVWSDACVNLTVFDGNGRPYSNPNTLSVTLYPRAALKDGYEPGCAYMLPGSEMLGAEIERIEEENERLRKSNENLTCSRDAAIQANSKSADYLREVCKILGYDPDSHAPSVAGLAKAKIDQLSADNKNLSDERNKLDKDLKQSNHRNENLLHDLGAISEAGGLEYSGDAVRVMIERLNSLRPTLCESEQPPGVSLASVETGLPVSPKYRAHAKVMRSYDYNHFEISLSCDDLSSLAEVDELRKNAARLAEKAVDQYQTQKEFETWKINNGRRDNLTREIEEIKANTPESEWTPEQKAKVKAYRDRQYWLNRDYDYEDEFDWESDREEDEMPL